MKRQFTSLRKQKIKFESTFTCREGFSALTTPVKSVPLNQMLFLKIVQKWFKNVTFKIYYLENSYSSTNLIFLCRTIRENSYRSVALNTLNTIRTFNTTNHTSRFPTGD